MPGGSTTTQQQSGTSSPWSAAQPELNTILSTLGGTNPSVTSGQTNAYGLLNSEVAGIPNYAPQASGVANSEFGYNTNPQQSTLNNAYGSVSGTLSPYLSSSYLNPMTTPGLSTELQGVGNSITNQVNSQFAAAGRDMSPANTTALAYGLEQGEAPIIANQYNQNVAAQQGAANSLESAANTTAGGLTQQQLAQLGINSQGLTTASAIPGVATAPGNAALTVANAQAQQPYTNLGWLSSLTDPIAALGGQSTSNGTTTQQTSLLSSILGGLTGGLGMLGSKPSSSTNPTTGATSTTGGSGILGLASLFSDERVKEDIHPVGMLYDNTPVYSYRYKKELDPTGTPRIGVMAQDIEKRRPDAVHEIGGVKAVDYGRATERARYMGMLNDLDMAA